MSRNVRRTAGSWPAAVAGAAAAVLLTACGGGDPAPDASSASDTAGSGASGSGTSETADATGAADFCDQAAGIDDRVDAALSDAEGDDPSVADAFRQIAEELRGIEAPAAISADWQAMSGGLDRMAEAFTGLDITDSDSLAALDAAEGDLSSASENVEGYLRDECGIDP